MADPSSRGPQSFYTPANKSHPDFQLPWIQTLLSDPHTHISEERPSGIVRSDNFFNYTLIHPTGLRTRIFFRRSTTLPEAITGHEECLIASLGRGLDGATGRAHGGFNSVLLDHLLGTCAFKESGKGLPLATATLTVDFKAPIGTPCVVLCRAWVSKISGRKYWTRGTIEDGYGKVYAEGKALFIQPREAAKPSL